MRRLLTVASALLFAACCCKAPTGSSAGSTSPSGTAESTEPTTPTGRPPTRIEPMEVIDIKTLLADYKANEVRADSLYKGKIIQTAGVVHDIKKGVVNDIYVTLGNGSGLEIPRVKCMVSSEQQGRAGSLNKGDKLTVKGRVGGLLMNVMFRDCQLL